jgi:hypothetical protein
MMDILCENTKKNKKVSYRALKAKGNMICASVTS